MPISIFAILAMMFISHMYDKLKGSVFAEAYAPLFQWAGIFFSVVLLACMVSILWQIYEDWASE